mmetsp:Transcript_23492/g.26055  ORF Transcript_23492/g.26055 Transcript_23492/m.26055 type:complete len:142 (-) Transcript_23492:43-468(-)
MSGKLFNFSPYCQKIDKIMSRGVKEIYIQGFILTKKHLQNLISYTTNLETFTLQECKIETLGVKFIDTNYTLSTIYFRSSGDEENSDWVNNPEGFVSLLTAIEECSLKHTLKTIKFYGVDFRTKAINDRCNDMGIELNYYD